MAVKRIENSALVNESCHPKNLNKIFTQIEQITRSAIALIVFTIGIGVGPCVADDSYVAQEDHKKGDSQEDEKKGKDDSDAPHIPKIPKKNEQPHEPKPRLV